MYANYHDIPGYGDRATWGGRDYDYDDSPTASDDIESAMAEANPEAPVPCLGHHPQGGAFEETTAQREAVIEAIGNDQAAEAALVALLRLNTPEVRALRTAAARYWVDGHADLLDELRRGVDV